MKFMGWLFVVLLVSAVIGFFADWADVNKHNGVVSLHINTKNINHDFRVTGEAIKSVFKE